MVHRTICGGKGVALRAELRYDALLPIDELTTSDKSAVRWEMLDILPLSRYPWIDATLLPG